MSIADGGRVLSDLASVRDQPELYGPVASDPTASRTLAAIGELLRAAIAAAKAKTRRRVWALIVAGTAGRQLDFRDLRRVRPHPYLT